MSEVQADRTVPTLEVRALRDGVVIRREPCETEADASALVQAWSDVDGVTVDVVDLTTGEDSAGVLEPRPWEVDAEDLGRAAVSDEEEER